MTKILHIWDVAGVGSLLVKYQRKQGHQADLFMRRDSDPLGLTRFYNPDALVDMDARRFYQYVFSKASNYDVIHVHAALKIVPFLKMRFALSNKQIIFHMHGGEYFFKNSKEVKLWRELSIFFADKVFVATENMLQYLQGSVAEKVRYIPTPVDRELFAPNSSSKEGKSDKALTFAIRYLNMDKLSNYLSENGRYDVLAKLDVVDREKNPIQYGVLPSFLQRYDSYIDIKFVNGALIPAMSKTGLEALSCGVPVLCHDLKTKTEFPEKHDANNIARLVTEKLYFD